MIRTIEFGVRKDEEYTLNYLKTHFNYFTVDQLRNSKILLLVEFFDIRDVLDVLNKIDQEVSDGCLTIIDQRMEALTWEIIDVIEKWFTSRGLKYILINEGLDVNEKYTSCITYPTMFHAVHTKQIDIFNRTMKFSTFNRMTERTNRVLFVYELFKRDLLKYGVVSCGSGDTEDVVKNYLSHMDLNDEFKQLLPLRFEDDMVMRENSSGVDFPENVSSQFHIIMETSYEYFDTDIRGFKHDWGWNRPVLTEKTTKAINGHQIPLWLTTKGFVGRMRDYGLDVFDDIVDHSYDLEDNPYIRIKKLTDEIERLCNLNLPNNKINERLSRNIDTLTFIGDKLRKTFIVDFNNLLLSKI